MRTQSDAIFDELLVLRWRRGDRTAIDDLIARWNRRLLYYVRRIVDDEQDAWDVLQQTWLQVVRKLATLRDPAKLPAWLYGVARNAAFAKRRTARANDRYIDREAEFSDAEHEDADLECEDVELVHHVMGKLTPAHREALTLLFLRDLSIEEIAEVLRVSAGTVKSRIHYAKRHMRQLLAEQGVHHA